MAGTTAVEQALIDALPARYPQRETLKDQSPWNDDYANAMRAVYQDHPDDLEVTTIFVEAIMNRTPWKMWDLQCGGVAEGAGTLEPSRCWSARCGRSRRVGRTRDCSTSTST